MPSFVHAQAECEPLSYFTNLPDADSGEKWWPRHCRDKSAGTADHDFYDGRIALVLGNAEAAEKHFRNALAKQPDHNGARVYLGLSVVHQGRNGAGAYHYRRALAGDLPRPVSEALRQFIKDESSPLGFGGYGYANIDRRTNPFLDSGITSVSVGDYIFYREAGDHAQTVLEAGGAIYYRRPLTETSAFYAQLGTAADYYTRTDDLEITITPLAAVEFNLSEQASASVGVQAEQLYFNGELFEWGFGPRLTFDYALSDRAHLWAAYTHQSIERPDDATRDGNSDALNLNLSRIETSRLVNYYSLSLIRYDYQAERLGYSEASARVRSQFSFADGIRGELSSMIGGRKYHGISNIFGKTREELFYSVSVTTGKDSIQWNGISPQVMVEYKGRNSNVDLYDYDDFGISLEFTKDF